MAKVKHCDRSKVEHYADGGQLGPYIEAHRQARGALDAVRERDAENEKHLNKQRTMGIYTPEPGKYDQNPQYNPEKSRPFDNKTLDEGMRMGPRRPYKLHNG